MPFFSISQFFFEPDQNMFDTSQKAKVWTVSHLLVWFKIIQNWTELFVPRPGLGILEYCNSKMSSTHYDFLKTFDFHVLFCLYSNTRWYVISFQIWHYLGWSTCILVNLAPGSSDLSQAVKRINVM